MIRARCETGLAIKCSNTQFVRIAEGRAYAIMIDDAREFGVSPDYPELATFLRQIELQFRTKPIVVDDAIVIIPDQDLSEAVRQLRLAARQ